ncbi:M2 family metallopeptidase [Sandaracinus amylolyticus]|uniref:M2 family metallopeptidase n=1 Tax=Sandaracinus amylolyticus TaxID=927083 RepID=UPI00069FAC04|nr:M2 family metallopeptidase [Sandaracinus amylolyticus]
MRSRFFAVIAALASVACAGSAPAPRSAADLSPQAQADELLALYDPIYVALYTESARAAWVAATDVSEEHTGQRTGADTAFAAFAGNAEVIRRARALLEVQDQLDPLTVRQLRQMLYLAASAPQTRPDLARARVAAEAQQSARLDGFQFCLARQGDTCTQPVTTNDLDRVLQTSTDLDERLRAWQSSKEVGAVLRDGLVELRGLRNGVAREMGYRDFFAFQVDNYSLTTEEMMALLDRLVDEVRPLYAQLQCWARHELAQRYGQSEVPTLIPAHWLGNRWGQSWPGLVEGIDMDSLVSSREPEWIVQQAERFYVSMGFPNLPQSFWEQSDLYPVPEGETRRKNAHASAWHVDLQSDVRSLMSVEPTWEWFTTTHHELGHIYYYISYSRPEVPYLLREGANRSYHEGIGDLISLAASQEPYLREIGLLAEGQEIDEMRWLLDSALTGPITFLPWSAGVMSHFERDLYAGELPPEEINRRWWEHVARYQGIAPPTERPAEGCDACTKTHINDDPGQYYDYALANVVLYQLHDHICRNILQQDPRACNYYGRREVGDFLRAVMSPGASRDWQEVLVEHTGRELTAEPMLEYYRPLMQYLEEQNRGRTCGF